VGGLWVGAGGLQLGEGRSGRWGRKGERAESGGVGGLGLRRAGRPWWWGLVAGWKRRGEGLRVGLP
jgi:hypothetical protein